jgi:hypothetical protein
VVKAAPLQIVAVWAATTGIGFTVTVTVKVAPGHPFALGVTVYTAVSGVVVFELDKVWLIDAWPTACAVPPVMPAPIAGAIQVYVVPAGTPAGVVVKAAPLQIVAVCAATTGIGFTVTVIVKVAPGHPFALGVTVYTAVSGVVVLELDKVWLIDVWPTACAVPPVTSAPMAGAVQVYVVPAGTPAGVVLKAAPLQIVAVCAATTGIGFTVTVTVNVAPGQPFALGVTVYTAVSGVVVLELDKVWLIDAWPTACAVPPVTSAPIVGAVQVYVIPTGTPAGVVVKAAPLQIVAVCAATTGIGFTVTVTVKVAPGHPFALGVTVYTAVSGVVVFELDKVWLIDAWPTACAVPPVTSTPIAGAVQV